MKLRAVAGLVAICAVLGAVACHRRVTPLLSLEECDPAGYIACIQQSSHLAIPITDTNLLLTYSSPAGTNAAKQWDAMPLGLGGWSLNVVQRYDRTSRLLIGGDGTWRRVDAVALPSGELAVPSYDGTLAYTFDSAGRHIRTVDGHLGIVLLNIGYDNAGHLSEVKGSLNGQPAHVRIQRDANGAPQALVGIDGGATALMLDGAGHLGRVTNPAGETTGIGWNSAGLVESQTDPAGGVQQFEYDSFGKLVSATDADGVTQTYARHASGNGLETRVSTALGRHLTYRAEFTKEGIRRTLIAFDGTETTETADLHGNRILSFADGTSLRISAVSSPVWGAASPILSPVVETRSDGVTSLREVKDNLQPQSGLPFVLPGSIATVINGQVWTQHFDPAHRTEDLVDPTGRKMVLHYGENGRLLSYSAPGAAPVSYTYNAEGRRESEKSGTGSLIRVARYEYDKDTGETTTIRPDGVVEKVMRDRNGRPIMLTAGSGATTLVHYDGAGRVNQIQPPGGLDFTIGSSPAGRTTAFVPPMVQGDSSIEVTSYDKDGAVTTTAGMGKRAVSFGYDSAGRVTSVSFDQGRRTRSYDLRSGLITQASDPGGVKTNYRYTGHTPTSLTWSGSINGSVSVALDANGRGVHESVNGGNGLDFGYDPAGFLTAVGPLSLTHDSATGLVSDTALGIVETKQEFDQYNQLIRETTTAGGSLLLDRRYMRDILGRIKTAVEIAYEGKSTTTEYDYDLADRLVSVRTNGRTQAYTYDPAGNRVKLATTSAELKASYDDRDRPLRIGSTQYTWMADGTLAGIVQGQRATAFVYDDFGALRQASLPDGRKIQYLVDPEGRRVGREIMGKLSAGYLYRADGFLVAETDGRGKVISRFGYDNSGHLAIVEHAGRTYRVVTDQVGSPRMIVDSQTGEVVERIAYDAWGNITQDTEPGFIPIGFGGGLRDPDTGLIRFGARDYDPISGRWTATDPIRFAGGQANLCSYVDDDPINARDPSGTECSLGMMGFSLGVSGIFGMGGGFNAQYITGSGWNLYSYGGAAASNDIGVGFNLNSGTIHNPSSSPEHDWEGWTQGLEVGYGPATAGFYESPNFSENLASGVPVYKGASLGIGASSSDLTLTLSRTYTKCLTCGSGNGSPGPGGGVPCNNQPGPPGPGGSGPGGPDQPDPNNPNQPNPNNPGQPNPNNPGQPNPNGPGKPNPNGPGQPNNPPPPGPGGGHGEPHLDTITGLHFDFQTTGEFLVASSRDGKYVIQARQEPYIAGAPVTVNTAIAANVNGDHIGVYVKEPAFLVINGVPLADADIERQLPHGGKLSRHGGTVQITWPDRSRLSVVRVAESLNYDFDPVSSAKTQFSGLLSGTNGRSDEIAARDGSTLSISDPAFVDKLYKQVGNGWRIRPSESLFHYWPGESTAKFTDVNFPPKYVSVDSLPSADRSKAESVCRAVGVRDKPLLDDCILDVVLTGKPGFAAASVGVRLANASGPTVAESNQTPPAQPTSAHHYSIRVGDSVSPDHPMRGAGIIQALGQKQYYSFSGTAGESIYLGLGPCDGAQPNFDLLNPDNKLLANVIGNCHADIGRQTLPVSGTYTIVASTDKANVNSRYNFFVHTIPPDQHFTVRLPVTVAPGSPAGSAGHMNAQGAQQFYDFSAPAGLTVHIEGKCAVPCPHLAIRPTGVADDSARFFDLNYLKNDWKLPEGGKYTIQVRSNGYVGSYSFTASVATSH